MSYGVGCGYLLAIALICLAAACGGVSPSAKKGTPTGPVSSDYASPEITGKINTPDVEESSGLAASACQSNVLWTHNDAGSGAFIYAIDTEGRHLGTWKVQNAQSEDWEDIALYKDASGKCFLLIGDIGNNKEDRSELTIYGVPEPAIPASGLASNVKQPLQTVPAESLRFKYPDKPYNAEAMLVHPRTRDIYVLTKRERGPSEVYKIKPAFGSSIVAEKVGELSLPAVPIGLLTGGSISPDGKRVVLCDYQSGYELILPDGVDDFDAIWKQTPIVVNLGKRKQGEAVTYSADGNAIYATSEGKNGPLTRVARR
jgi:hypothetical protein